MRLLRSISVAFRGIAIAIHTQVNMKIHLVVIITVVVAGVYFSITAMEWIVLVLTIGLVVSLELVNTAIEEMVNFVSPKMNDAAGRVKDIAAGAVLVAAIVALIIAFLIFWKYLSV